MITLKASGAIGSQPIAAAPIGGWHSVSSLGIRLLEIVATVSTSASIIRARTRLLEAVAAVSASLSRIPVILLPLTATLGAVASIAPRLVSLVRRMIGRIAISPAVALRFQSIRAAVSGRGKVRGE